MLVFRCVLTPGDPYMPLTNDKIIGRVIKQVSSLKIIYLCFKCSSAFLLNLNLRQMTTLLDHKVVLSLFPSSQGLDVIWSSVVKIAQSLYREGPGKDPFRPDQETPVKNFFLAGSYTKQ
ncbi:hypothetical protein GIB67_001890, partial [Kingdonia uniflora]